MRLPLSPIWATLLKLEFVVDRPLLMAVSLAIAVLISGCGESEQAEQQSNLRVRAPRVRTSFSAHLCRFSRKKRSASAL